MMVISPRRCPYFALFFLMAGFFMFVPPTFAEITFEGLEEHAELHEYLKEHVTDHFEEQEEEEIYTSAVKARIKKATQAEGYYDVKIVKKTDNEDIYVVTPGALYEISSYEVLGYQKDPPPLQLTQGTPLVAKNVLNAQRTLATHISNENCFFQLSVRHRIFLDRLIHGADIKFDVNASGEADFGATTFTGADNIDRDYLYNFVEYEDGACWKATQLEDTKTALLQTGLISTIDVQLPENVPPDGRVPVVMKLKERAPRKVRLGANYSTSDGPGIIAEWLHRNFFGSGEELSITTRISAVLQRLGLDFTKPFFLSDKQSFKFSTALQREDTDAYEELGLSSSAAISRDLSDHWTGSLGVGLDLLQVREDGEETENFTLVSFPGTLNFDNRDDALDPHKGFTLRLLAAPFVDAIGTSSPFFKTRATGTTYISFGKKFLDAVLALRASVGSILGTETQEIPASQRFYAGGGGSIRGFGFQEAGPIDDDGDPAGGRSVFESTAELRLKFTDTVGGAAFIDGGGVYDSALPDFEGGAYVGAGIGLRYYTDFGPVRLDFAVPLNKKDDLDQDYQIYISIGQAF